MSRRRVLIVVLVFAAGGAFSYGTMWLTVVGIVAIGLSTLQNSPEVMQPALMLRTIRIPVLDIFGSNDLHEVVSYANARRTAADQAGNKQYLAVKVPGADHFFTDHYSDLQRHITDWLKRYKGK
mgnify:CR=1 FL=1